MYTFLCVAYRAYSVSTFAGSSVSGPHRTLVTPLGVILIMELLCPSLYLYEDLAGGDDWREVRMQWTTSLSSHVSETLHHSLLSTV